MADSAVNLEQRMSSIRWALIVAGGVGAGLIFAFTVVGSGHFDTGSMGAGQDAHAYWRAIRVEPYNSNAGDFGAYLYSPAFLQVLNPILSLAWGQFLTLWAALLLATLLVLTGPVLFVFALPVAFFEIWGGNIHLLLALAIVLGFRWPGTWSFALLTKVTPGVGLLWFAARKEWRKLAIALGTTAAIVAVSLAFDPNLWRSWIDLLIREASGTASEGHIPIPLLWRLPFAAALAIYAGRTDRKWLLPVVAFIAMPVLWWGSLSVLIGCVALERERVEKFVLTTLATAPSWLLGRLARRQRRRAGELMPEPEV
jgi:Glycosyltransferase family 87